MSAERLGIPAAALITDRFEETARRMAAVQGLPDYPFVVIEHPIANAGDEELGARADRALPRIVELLTRRTA